MRQTPANLRFKNLSNKAVLHANAGEWRAAADAYRVVYEKSDGSEFEGRYWSLSGYTSIFRQEQATAKDKDIDFLERLSKDKTCAAPDRALAGLTLGLSHWLVGRREDCVKTYRRVLKMEIPERERGRRILNGKFQATTGAELFEDTVQAVRENLDALHQSPSAHFSSSDPLPSDLPENGGMMRPCVVPTGPLPHGLTEEIAYKYTDLAMSVPGSQCDACKAPPPPGKKLYRCSRCTRKWYCCNDCQKKDWKGHKKSCREPQDFRPRDLVRLSGIERYPKLNGNLVEVRGPASAEGRFATAYIGGEKEMSVSAANMTLIVPAEERLDDVKA